MFRCVVRAYCLHSLTRSTEFDGRHEQHGDHRAQRNDEHRRKGQMQCMVQRKAKKPAITKIEVFEPNQAVIYLDSGQTYSTYVDTCMPARGNFMARRGSSRCLPQDGTSRSEGNRKATNVLDYGCREKTPAETAGLSR